MRTSKPCSEAPLLRRSSIQKNSWRPGPTPLARGQFGYGRKQLKTVFESIQNDRELQTVFAAAVADTGFRPFGPTTRRQYFCGHVDVDVFHVLQRPCFREAPDPVVCALENTEKLSLLFSGL